MPRPVHHDTHLDGALDDLDGLTWIPGVEQILTGFREAAVAAARGDLSLDATQSLIAAIAGSPGADLVSTLGYLIQHLTNPTTNPTLTNLPADKQKTAQRYGEQTAHLLDDPDLHHPAAEASAAITD